MSNLILDLDGVIVDTYGEHLCTWGNQLFGTNVTLADLTDYNLPSCTPWTHEKLNVLFSNPEYYKSAKATYRAISAIRMFKDIGWSQHVITARCTELPVHRATLQWLGRRGVPFDSLHFTNKQSNSHNYNQTDQKVEIARSLKVVAAIEDSPYNARKYSEICDVVFLVTNSLNSHEVMPRNVIRINNLPQAIPTLRELCR